MVPATGDVRRIASGLKVLTSPGPTMETVFVTAVAPTTGWPGTGSDSTVISAVSVARPLGSAGGVTARTSVWSMRLAMPRRAHGRNVYSGSGSVAVSYT